MSGEEVEGGRDEGRAREGVDLFKKFWFLHKVLGGHLCWFVAEQHNLCAC